MTVFVTRSERLGLDDDETASISDAVLNAAKYENIPITPKTQARLLLAQTVLAVYVGKVAAIRAENARASKTGQQAVASVVTSFPQQAAE